MKEEKKEVGEEEEDRMGEYKKKRKKGTRE